MNRKILIYIGLVLIIGLVIKCQSTEMFANQNINKKKILVTGLRARVIGEFISKQIIGSGYELVIHVQQKEEKLSNDTDMSLIIGSIDKNEITNTIELLVKSGPYDIIIHNLHDPEIVSGSILNINNNINIQNRIKFINKIIKYVKPSGKIVSLITDLEEFSGGKIVDYDMEYFFKSQSIENYKNAIGFTTIKFQELSSDTAQFSSVLDFILQNPWTMLTGREFYSGKIHNKTPGYMFELDKVDSPGLENNFKQIENIHTNYYQALKTKLAVTNNIDKNNIKFFTNTKSFLSNIINKFVPSKHHIILFNLPDHNFIPIDRAVTTDTWKIQNKQLVPDYKKILEKINSLTRLIYFSGFINKNELTKFIEQIPTNILVVVDMTWNNFLYQGDKSLANSYRAKGTSLTNSYRAKGTSRCFAKTVYNSVKTGQLIDLPNVISINAISKIYDIVDISLGYSVANMELTGIISNFGNSLESFNEKAIIDKLDDPAVELNKKYYSEQLGEFIRILDAINVNYYMVNPITIKIILDKSDDVKLSNAMRYITLSNSNYLEIIKGTKSNEIIIYLDNELANRANKLLVQKL